MVGGAVVMGTVVAGATTDKAFGTVDAGAITERESLVFGSVVIRGFGILRFKITAVNTVTRSKNAATIKFFRIVIYVSFS